MATPDQEPIQYVTNLACTVRVGGVPVRVPASTHLPAGVSDDEIARLLRFNVIRPYEPEAEPEPEPKPEPDVPEATARSTRKKATATKAEPNNEE